MKKLLALGLLVLLMGFKPKDSFRFGKIVFHTTECFGACPVYHMEVNNKKEIKLYVEKAYQKNNFGALDSAKVGNFVGKLSDTTYAKLVRQIKALGVDNMEVQQINCCDAPIKTLIVYHNGKRRYIRSMIYPQSANPLIEMLYTICATSPLKKVNHPLNIEPEQVKPTSPSN